MKTIRVLGVRCEVKGDGFFPEIEKIVRINGADYSVWNENLLMVGEEVYVKAINARRSRKTILVGLNVVNGYENVRARESDLLFKAA